MAADTSVIDPVLSRKAQIFETYIKREIKFYQKYYEGPVYKALKAYGFNIKNKGQFEPLKKLLSNYQRRLTLDFKDLKRQIDQTGRIYFDSEDQRLRMALWSSKLTNDDYGTLTPFGPMLVEIGEMMGHHNIGILDALEQQLYNKDAKDVERKARRDVLSAQLMLIVAYEVFQKFCNENKLKDDYKYPPLVQLVEGRASAWASDKEVPTIVVINREKATHKEEGKRVEAFAALPHELGHDIMDTFKNDGFINEMKKTVEEDEMFKGIRDDIWKSWMFEAVADATGVALLGIPSINGLMAAMQDIRNPLDLIIKDGDDYDSHPNANIRVKLTFEVAQRYWAKRLKHLIENEDDGNVRKTYEQQLEAFKKGLREAKTTWRKYLEESGYKELKSYKNAKTSKYVNASTLEGAKGEIIRKVAELILDTPYDILKKSGKDTTNTLRDLFDGIHDDKKFQELSKGFASSFFLPGKDPN